MKKYLIIALFFLSGAFSCSDMNDLHDKYLRDGETLYISVFDSLQVNPGNKRVELLYWLSDPKASKVRIYWNLREKTEIRDIFTTTEDHPGRILLEGIEEGSVSFEFFNHDADFKYTSVIMNKTVSVYGDFYATYLINRLIRSVTYDPAGEKLTIDWTSAAYEDAIGVEIRYRDASSGQQELTVPLEEKQTVLEDFPAGGTFEWRTGYLPEEHCIDVFYTPFESRSAD